MSKFDQPVSLAVAINNAFCLGLGLGNGIPTVICIQNNVKIQI